MSGSKLETEPKSGEDNLRRRKIMKNRLYHILAINDKTGYTRQCTGYPMSHAACCVMMGKFNLNKNVRLQLTEV